MGGFVVHAADVCSSPQGGTTRLPEHACIADCLNGRSKLTKETKAAKHVNQIPAQSEQQVAFMEHALSRADEYSHYGEVEFPLWRSSSRLGHHCFWLP